MSSYSPIHIAGNKEGLIQGYEEFLYPDDAYPVLTNAYIYRQQIRKKLGADLIGRLQRNFTSISIGNSGASPWLVNLYGSITTSASETEKQIKPGSVVIVIGAITFTDQGNGNLNSATPGNSGTIDYISGDVVLIHTAGAGIPSTATFTYYPSLPVMGIRTQETNSIDLENAITFDTVYAYGYNGVNFFEYIPGTTWTGDNLDFFWSTNYWVSASNAKLFWVTNNNDPIRYTDGSTWTSFTPSLDNSGSPVLLKKCLALLPYRSRLLAFNTTEGVLAGPDVNYFQRIRWSQIGNPISSDAWYSNIPGKGGYIDIPTSESIVLVGFVRDNIIICCDRTTWALRYTGRSIQPFIVEKINSELGAESTFAGIQFDTWISFVGDKGIVNCDSYKSERIDIKIPDFVFNITQTSNAPSRVCGFRDFKQRICYWSYPTNTKQKAPTVYPNRRLIYNYEDNSWAIFKDSYTAFGNIQPGSGRTWTNTKAKWKNAFFPWASNEKFALNVAAGNQQGYVFWPDKQGANDQSLQITNITAGTPVSIECVSHNLEEGTIIKIINIPNSTAPNFSSLNNGIYYVEYVNANNFNLYSYDSNTSDFDTPVSISSGNYIGGGEIIVKDNFYIQSKKFNFLQEGKNIQIGYLDLLCVATNAGEFSLNVLLNYNNTNPVNIYPENIDIINQNISNEFFNKTIPTFKENNITSDKYWQRVFCPVRGNFISLLYTFSPEQMAGNASDYPVQIDAQCLWVRRAGRMTGL